MTWLRRIFCKHDWQKLSETLIPSAAEQYGEGRSRVKVAPSFVKDFFRSKFVLSFKCPRCGSLHVKVVTNP
jgi:hypothetical protein